MRWSEAFLNGLRWYAIAGSAVVGTSAFIISDNTGSIKPFMLGVLAYGVVYMVSYFWEAFRQKILLISIIVFLVISFSSSTVVSILSLFSGHDPASYDPYIAWLMSMGVFGIPVMTFVFRKLG